MYTGTMIEDLIQSVALVELHAQDERSFTWGRNFEQGLASGRHGLNQDSAYQTGRIEVA